MPKYTKFMKDLLNNKRKLEDLKIVTILGNCSTYIQNKLQKKLTDPSNLIISCVIGEGMQENVLASSRANINVMAYNLFLKLGLEDLRPTRMTLQLSDRSVRKTRGVVEDVLVKVDKLIILVNFVILDMDDNVKVPLFLGHPFLNTSVALIDEVLALNPLYKYLEDIEVKEVEEQISTPPPKQQEENLKKTGKCLFIDHEEARMQVNEDSWAASLHMSKSMNICGQAIVSERV
ncbi:uncharacterized protein LOC120284029 [Dioscorea cayenensis subsp. rotundata]|uniref:Uncharacterized protein LOC120284029 n=1 Tax=Dioscorea cayennensis subsp. rotundata TaxID=55577 RepID=A0AB40D5U8_DIOCR|nr:uncharacterized protein LOC120284029 [Dioscorea cayenensis subsp. rotundata]